MGARDRFLVTDSNGDVASKKVMWFQIFASTKTTSSEYSLSLEFQFFTASTKFLANEYLANLLFKGGW